MTLLDSTSVLPPSGCFSCLPRATSVLDIELLGILFTAGVRTERPQV